MEQNVVKLEDIRQMQERVDRRRDELKEQDSSGGGGDEFDAKFVGYCFDANELGDGELFCRLYGDRFVFDKAADHWLEWQGHHWQPDRMNRAQASIEGLVDQYTKLLEQNLEQLYKCTDDERKKQLRKRRDGILARISGLRSTRRRSNCLTMAHTCETPLAITGDEIDRQPWKLACANGVVDLRTGALHPGRHHDYLCKASPVEWQGIDAACEPWETALMEIMDGNETLVAFLRRSLGMALIGEVMTSAFFVWTGIGRNGKSLIAETICQVLGPLAGTIRSEMLLDQGRVANASGPTPDIMHLRGLRIAFASETDDGCKISPSRVKWLTGRDQLVGRNPHDKYEVQFDPTHTLFLLTNHKPQAPVEDFAFWERMHLVPFDMSFVNREPQKENERTADPELPRKLREVYPGILAWVVRGCLEYKKVGLDPPPAVREATDEYKADEDQLGDFIAECIEATGDPEDTMNSTQLHDIFSKWWRRRVHRNPPSQKRFGGWMKRRFDWKRSGYVHYVGIRLSIIGEEILEGSDDWK